MRYGGNLFTRPPSDCFAIDLARHAKSPDEGDLLTPIQRTRRLMWSPLRRSTEHILIVESLRAEGIEQNASLAPYVSIISNRASNSCSQAVQRIQSDSTVNWSDLIPMPPQSGQRARWAL